jgi:hypothetical protein
VQAGVGQLHLRLDTGDLGDAEVCGRLLVDVPQQGGLADARLAANDQDRALTGLRALAQTVEKLSLSRPTS